jgi:hypothetical protein
VTSSKSDKSQPGDAPTDRKVRAKRRYEKPRLTDYGLVSKLTQTGGITVADSMTKFAKSCL